MEGIGRQVSFVNFMLTYSSLTLVQCLTNGNVISLKFCETSPPNLKTKLGPEREVNFPNKDFITIILSNNKTPMTTFTCKVSFLTALNPALGPNGSHVILLETKVLCFKSGICLVFKRPTTKKTKKLPLCKLRLALQSL